MSKGLEAFKKIAEIHGNTGSLEGTYEYFLTIKRALVRLEAIENANPSEALKELELVENWIRDRELKISNVIKPSLNTIKQALLKAQENEKVLKIIKEKPQAAFSFIQLGKIKTYEEYLEYTRVWDLEYWDMVYTEEEFDLIKRWSE